MLTLLTLLRRYGFGAQWLGVNLFAFFCLVFDSVSRISIVAPRAQTNIEISYDRTCGFVKRSRTNLVRERLTGMSTRNFDCCFLGLDWRFKPKTCRYRSTDENANFRRIWAHLVYCRVDVFHPLRILKNNFYFFNIIYMPSEGKIQFRVLNLFPFQDIISQWWRIWMTRSIIMARCIPRELFTCREIQIFVGTRSSHWSKGSGERRLPNQVEYETTLLNSTYWQIWTEPIPFLWTNVNPNAY